jgi:hypothetical protein
MTELLKNHINEELQSLKGLREIYKSNDLKDVLMLCEGQIAAYEDILSKIETHEFQEHLTKKP